MRRNQNVLPPKFFTQFVTLEFTSIRLSQQKKKSIIISIRRLLSGCRLQCSVAILGVLGGAVSGGLTSLAELGLGSLVNPLGRVKRKRGGCCVVSIMVFYSYLRNSASILLVFAF